MAALFRDVQPEASKIPIQPYSGQFVVGGSLVAVNSKDQIKIYDLSLADMLMFIIDTKELELLSGAKVNEKRRMVRSARLWDEGGARVWDQCCASESCDAY